MPSLGVNVVLFKNKQVLLTKRSDLPIWCLPGGHVEAGESIVEAAIREVKEETGMEVSLVRMLGVYSRPDWGSIGGDHGIVFIGEIKEGTLIQSTDETEDADFFDIEALPEKLDWWDRMRIQDAINNEKTGAWLQTVNLPLHIKGKSRHELFLLIKEKKMDEAEVVHYFTSLDADNESIKQL